MFRRFAVWTLFSNAATAPFVLRNSSSVSDSVTPKILGHVPGHVFVDSKGLVPESRNSHIVLRLCVLRFSRIRFSPRGIVPFTKRLPVPTLAFVLSDL